MAIKILNDIPTVITAGHVCDVGPSEKIEKYIQTVEVLDHNSTIHQAWPLLISHNDSNGKPDACLLFVPTLKVKLIKIEKRKPTIGEDLYYIGAPAGIYSPPNPLMFKGVFSGDLNGSTAQITVPATGGSSGAAVLNLKNNIVGIIWGTNLRFNHATVMTSHKSFMEFIKNGKQRLLSFSKK